MATAIASARGGFPAAAAANPLDRYNLLDELGSGTYGVVFRAEDRQTGRIVALKKMRLDRTDEGIPQTALREVSILQEVNHRNIVNLLDVICTGTKLFLVFEYVELDLKKAIDRRKSFGGRELKLMMAQLLEGLYFCHRHRIVHRDLKPANILLAADGTVKIADFGLARAFQIPMHTYTHEVVTLWYRAPEILLGEKHYSPAVDMWSVGCIMAELARGKVLFRGDTEIGELYEIFQLLGTPADMNGLWPGVSRLPDYSNMFPKWEPKDLGAKLPMIDREGIDLLSRMFKYHPAERITCRDAMQHPWFNEIRTGA